MNTWMKDGLLALVLGLVFLAVLLLGRVEGPIVTWLPIGMFLISFLGDSWRHRNTNPSQSSASTWMKDGLLALVLGLISLAVLLLGRVEGPLVIWLPIVGFFISFLGDSWRHRNTKFSQSSAK